MATKKKTKGKLPWHSAFFAGIQIEFEKEAEKYRKDIQGI